MISVGIVLNSGIFSTNKSMYVSEAQMSSVFFQELVSARVNTVIIGAFINSGQKKQGVWEINHSSILHLGKVPKGKINRLLFYLYLSIKSFIIPLPGFVYFFFPGNVSLALLPGIIIRGKDYALYMRGELRYKNKFTKRFIKYIMKKAFCILATGESIASVANKHNTNVEQVVPMMNVKEKDLNKRNNVAIDKPTKVLFLSAIHPDKGIIEAIEAIKSLINSGHNIRFLIVGGGSDDFLKRVESEISGFESSISIEGKVIDTKLLHEYYRSSDIFVFPSYHEGFPRVLYEAMTFSMPIIASDIPGTDGIMVHKENCIKVPPKDSVKLAEAIKLLANDSSLREQLSSNAYKTMEGFFEQIEGNSHAKQLIKKLNKYSSRNNL